MKDNPTQSEDEIAGIACVKKAYDEMSVEEFDTYGPVNKTLPKFHISSGIKHITGFFDPDENLFVLAHRLI